MPRIASPLTTSTNPAARLIASENINRVGGVVRYCPDESTLLQWAAVEASNRLNLVPIWFIGELVKCGTDPDHVYRKWNGSSFDIVPAPSGGGGGTQKFKLFGGREEVKGNIPLLIFSGYFPAGVYSAPAAEIGCDKNTDIATLTIAIENGSTIKTIGGVAGNVTWRTASSGFTLQSSTKVNIMLSTNNVNAKGIVVTYVVEEAP